MLMTGFMCMHVLDGLNPQGKTKQAFNALPLHVSNARICSTCILYMISGISGYFRLPLLIPSH